MIPSRLMNTAIEVVVVAGLSGAGRTTALRALEDLSYYCVDNLPPSAFEVALDACEKDGLARVAIGIDVRVRSFLDATLAAINAFAARDNYSLSLLFLDASDAALLTRFSGTRRPHPLASRPAPGGDGSQSMALVDGIKLEKARLAPFRARASVVIDTSDLSVHELRRQVVELFRDDGEQVGRMRTRFVSFGFKYGNPTDVDLMFDVRFIENPYFKPELRPRSGLDKEIQDFVLGQPAALEFVRLTQQMLAFLIPQYEREGKSYLTVGFGCTGGRHRSVVLSEHLGASVGASVGTRIKSTHRDLVRVHLEALERERVQATARGVAFEPTSDRPSSRSR